MDATVREPFVGAIEAGRRSSGGAVETPVVIIRVGKTIAAEIEELDVLDLLVVKDNQDREELLSLDKRDDRV